MISKDMVIMNWRISGMRNKTVFILMFFLITGWLFCENINVFVNVNKYLMSNGKTRFEIVYQIPNQSILYEKSKNNFLGKVKVDLFLEQNNEIKYQDHFINKIGARNFQETMSKDKYFLDKLQFSFANSEYNLRLIFTDINNGTTTNFTKLLAPFEVKNLISDVEFSTKTLIDSTQGNKYLKRGNKIFFVNPSHIYTKGINDSIVTYFELYNNSNQTDQYNVQLNVTRNDSLIDSKMMIVPANQFMIQKVEKFSLEKFIPGYYKIDIVITAVLQSKKNTLKSYFIVKENNLGSIRFFEDIQDDFKLITYFISPKNKKVWRNLDKKGKINYINKFWNIINSQKQSDNFENTVRQRIIYANNHYSGFKKGWLTDRGRILIRNGAPESIDKDRTDLKTKYTQKEYQIWKYRRNMNRTYIFLDLQNNGNYQLIYSDNDDFEVSTVNWEKYLGDNFDKSQLE
jgi:GWxTD domain-containing protein